MSNEHLDRAIVAALEAHKMAPEALNDQMRDFTRALVAELLRGMEQEVVLVRSYQHGFNDALAEIKRRAGLGGEG